MKISKLFHWLYAFLMLVPVAVFGTNAIYYGFNDEAVSQTYTKEEPVYYETNELNDINDLIVGHIYTINTSLMEKNDTCTIFCQDFFIYSLVNNIGSYSYSTVNEPYFSIFTNDASTVLVNTARSICGYTQGDLVLDFVYKSHYGSLSLIGTNYSITSCYRSYVRFYEEVTYTNGIADSLAETLEHTFELPMFSWVTNSVVYDAFNGLSMLVGFDNSVVPCFLTYWLDISLVWLAFDMLMFLPMWAHKQLDRKKGW